MNTRTTMRTLARRGGRVGILASAIMLALSLPQEVAAQSASATLRGRSAAGTEITATNTATGLTRRAQAASDGSYVILGLPPGTYRVDAGPGTERNVTLVVASTATLDFAAAQQAGTIDEVVVSA